MASEVKIIFAADGKQAVEVSKQITDAYKTLGAKSLAEIERSKAGIVAAYEAIKKSGTVSAAEILQAEAAKDKALAKAGESLLGRNASITGQIKQHWLAATAAIAAAVVIINQSIAYAEMGAKARQAEEAFRSVAAEAGESADKIIAAMSRASAGTMDASDMMQKALKGMTQDLSGADMIRIMEMARIAARTQGIDVGEAFNRLTDSIANQMPRALKQFGLITTEQMGIVNKAIAAGVDEVNLLDIAYDNFLIKQARMKPATDNATEAIQRHRAALHDLREEAGKGILDVLGALADAFFKIRSAAEAANASLLAGQYRKWAAQAKTPAERELNLRLAAEQDAKNRPEIARGVVKPSEDEARDKLKRDLDEIKAKTEAAKKAAQWEQVEAQFKAWQVTINNLNPALDDTQRKLAEINQQSEKFTKAGVGKAEIERWKALAGQYLTGQQFMKDVAERERRQEEYDEKTRAGNQARVKAAEEYEREITIHLADELGKRLLAEEEQAKRLRELASKSGADYEAEDARITRRMEENKARIRAEIASRTETARIEAQIAGVARAEKLFAISKPEATSRLKSLYDDLLARQETYLTTLSETGDNTAWLTQAQRIEETRNKLTDLALDMKTFSDDLAGGLSWGWAAWLHNAKTQFQIGEDLIKNFADNSRQILEDFLFDPIEMNWTSALDSMRRIFARTLSELAVDALKVDLRSGTGFLSMLGFGGSKNPWGETGFLTEFHSGGIVGETPGIQRLAPLSLFARAPRLHGGLAPDEFPAILQRGETVFPRGAGPAVNVAIHVENKTGAAVKASEGPMRFDGNQWIKTVSIELAATDIDYRTAHGLR